ncbi:hypothetical protein IV203_000337 [Nitzschia inconspicua]|uniref:Uncharacterized protein n=1 Tax=Nitzschia inconspicua TaxID=303405 RepID=A0A9K3L697_9STRA|nr:hypothetical protein IV203_000337 [Nitzschia inconspicua]
MPYIKSSAMIDENTKTEAMLPLSITTSGFEESVVAPMIVTPTSPESNNWMQTGTPVEESVVAPMIATPTSPESINWIQTDTPTSSNNHEYDQAMLATSGLNDSEDVLVAIENLVEGIKIVKKTLDKSLEDGCHEILSHDDSRENSDRISYLSSHLVGVLGSTLLGLWNASNAVRGHVQLLGEENALLLEELHCAKRRCLEAHYQSERADKVNRRLYREKQSLMEQVQLLRADRRVLVKECKVLRKVARDTRKFDTWRLLEEHVRDSVAIHENILKSAPVSAVEKVEEEMEEDTEQAISGISDRRIETPSPSTIISDLTVMVDKDTTVDDQNPQIHENKESLLAEEEKMQEISEAPSKMLGFFSRFSITSCSNSNAQKQPPRPNHVIEERKEDKHRLEKNDSSPESINSSQSFVETKAMVLSDDLALVEEDESQTLSKSGNNHNESESTGTIGRLRGSSHFPRRKSTSSAASNTVSEASYCQIANMHGQQTTGSGGETCTTESKGSGTSSVSDPSKVKEESSFTFDRTYRVVIPAIIKTLEDAKSLGDEDRTGCTESSHSDMLDSDFQTSQQGMPSSVSFRSNSGGAYSRSTSPLLTPEHSPKLMCVPILKPTYDPCILRTLAIPSSDLDKV